MIRAELGGERAPGLIVENTKLELQSGIYVIRFDHEESDRGSYELGCEGPIRTIIFRGELGTYVGRTIPATYQLKGNRMRVCYSFGDKSSPAYSPSANQVYVAIYRRCDYNLKAHQELERAF